jgi:hypothetical protein
VTGFSLITERSGVQVSCNVNGCVGCDYVHNKAKGAPRYYVVPKVRVPKRVAVWLRSRLS